MRKNKNKSSSKVELPTWNLSDLYKSQNDKKVFSDLNLSLNKAKAFRKSYGKYIPSNPKKVLNIIKQYEAIELLASKPIIYANLLFAESVSVKGRGAFVHKVRSLYSEVRKELVLFELNLSCLSIAELNKLARSPVLKPYKHYLESVLNAKPHRLSEEAEKILTDKDLSGRSSWMRLFDEEFAHKKFEYKSNQVNESEVLNKLYSSKREDRKLAQESLTEGLKADSRRITYIFNVLLQDKQVEDSLRNYQRAESSRHLSNETNHKIVETMCLAVEDYYPLVQQYYKLKKKLLKLNSLYDYDRYAPVAVETQVIPYEQAKELVLESFYSFSKEYGDIAKLFFDNNWVDVANREGKRGGAFCSFVTPDLHPYVFMNYHGSVREVFTLAHELGHAIHAYLMRKQSYLQFDTPLTIAETASVFAEMLLFDKLVEKTKDNKQLIALYSGKLESIFATVFRQIGMYRFEQDVHYAYRESGELSTEHINHLWRARQEQMFRDSVTLTEGYDYWWSYIPHFIHTPFYVYAYAFGELLTVALFAHYKKQPAPFVDKYFNLLASGGSLYPEELMKPFGIDLSKKSFWVGGLKIIEEMVNTLEELI